MEATLDREACYRALLTRDARFDGVFYVGVLSTGIFCRPICPAGPPKFENCIFLPSAAAAHQQGLRPCLRCRPELVPGIASWRGTANTVSRALYLIAEGALNETGVEAFSDRLGVTARHLRRLFYQHLGASPVAVAQTQRLLFAKRLLSETSLPMAEVAMAAGYGSVRRFNAAVRRTYGVAPTQLRQRVGRQAGDLAAVTLKLPYRPPYDWDAMIGFLAQRAIPGVEVVRDGRYLRTFAVDAAEGVIEVGPGDGDHLLASIHTSDVSVLAKVISRLRRLFDLDAEAAVIDSQLAADPLMAQRIIDRPGIRVPGAWDGFELAVRAVLGQQISVSAATTLAGRLAELAGARLTEAVIPPDAAINRIFPSPAALARADLGRIGLTRQRAETIRQLGERLVEEPGLLQPFAELEAAVARLQSLPGIGAWTAQYIAMRALREPDAFPASDLGLLRALEDEHGRPTPARMAARSEAWRPWRAYAAMRLWLQPAGRFSPD